MGLCIFSEMSVEIGEKAKREEEKNRSQDDQITPSPNKKASLGNVLLIRIKKANKERLFFHSDFISAFGRRVTSGCNKQDI